MLHSSKQYLSEFIELQFIINVSTSKSLFFRLPSLRFTTERIQADARREPRKLTFRNAILNHSFHVSRGSFLPILHYGACSPFLRRMYFSQLQIIFRLPFSDISFDLTRARH